MQYIQLSFLPLLSIHVLVDFLPVILRSCSIATSSGESHSIIQTLYSYTYIYSYANPSLSLPSTLTYLIYDFLCMLRRNTFSVLHDIERFLAPSVSHFNFLSNSKPRYPNDKSLQNAKIIKSSSSSGSVSSWWKTIFPTQSSVPSTQLSTGGATPDHHQPKSEAEGQMYQIVKYKLRKLYKPQVDKLKELLHNSFNITLPQSWIA